MAQQGASDESSFMVGHNHGVNLQRLLLASILIGWPQHRLGHQHDPIGDIVTDQFIATEIVRSAVGTMGLVAAVPVTTATRSPLRRRGDRRLGLGFHQPPAVARQTALRHRLQHELQLKVGLSARTV